ncbi:Protein IN2-1-like protein B [Bienertia sinuspersici]
MNFVSASASTSVSLNLNSQIVSVFPSNPIKSNTLSFLPYFPKQNLHSLSLQLKIQRRPFITASTMSSTGKLEEVLPPPLDSTSEPPPLFDGTSRLYISYTCPYAQRVWITRNCKGLLDKIKSVPINLLDRPSWYKEKFTHQIR